MSKDYAPGTPRYEDNVASRAKAVHHREPWTDGEDQFLRELWDGTEECLADIAEILGRTIEACRQRFYLPVGHRESKPASSSEPRPRPAWMDEEGLPDWYV